MIHFNAITVHLALSLQLTCDDPLSLLY